MLASLLVMTGCQFTRVANTTPIALSSTVSQVVPHTSADDPPIVADIVIGWEFSKDGNSLGWVPTHD